MSLFSKKPRVMPVPEPFTAEDVRIESSICTGEKTIGFYDKSTRKLRYSELVKNDADISAFYEKYGIKKDRTEL